jgi:release factor glutamine methyltransferase
VSRSTVPQRHLDFDGLRIGYDARVLTPRPWTALQSHWAARLAEELAAGPVLELCSGAGQIGLLAVRDNDRQLLMVDADPVACAWARHNARAAGMASRVEVRQGPMDVMVLSHEEFPLIVADPPWVQTSHVPTFPEDPVLAIDGGNDGLDLVRATVDVVVAHLRADGAALLQVGPTQVASVHDLVAEQASGLIVRDQAIVEGRGAVVELRPR